MRSGQEAPAEQIIIVRRKGYGEEEGHHGGVWKIAYADFMTAMMAFFLVMWLINAANTETRAAVASYFNPLRLTDNASRKKGLKTVDEKANAEDQQKKSGKDAHEGQKAGGGGGPQPEQSGEAITRGKTSGLTDGIDNAIEERHMLALADAKSAPAVKRESPMAAGAATLEAGKAFRDPFNPILPSSSTEMPPGPGQHSMAGAREPSREIIQHGMAGAPPAADSSQVFPAEDAFGAGKTVSDAKDVAAMRAASGQDQLPGKSSEAIAATAEQLRSDVQSALGKLGGAGGPGMDVAIEGGNIVLSLTDTNTFGMFAIGSAAPSPELVQLISSITPMVAASGEDIVIRGHTDGREYRSVANNNWRLSMARAETAYALLTKAGIAEGRVQRIEAHADRKLKVTGDPNAAPNRRIEILISPKTKP